MDLFYRRPSFETRNAMSKSALNLKHIPGSRYEEIDKCRRGCQKIHKT